MRPITIAWILVLAGCGCSNGGNVNNDAGTVCEGGGGAGTTCDVGATQCSGDVPQTCGSNGAWLNGTPCSSSTTCVLGACGGVCGPGQTRCSGDSIQACDSNGRWGSAWPCSTSACDGGACSGSTTTGTSCQAGGVGATTCGANKESCCTSTEVPGGAFYRVYDSSDAGVSVSLAADGGPTGEAYPATVSGFRLDRYLVTVGRFRQFVSAWNNGWTPAQGAGKHAYLNGGQGLVNGGCAASFEPGWIASDGERIAPTTENLRCTTGATWTSSASDNENLPINCVNWYEAYAFCIWDGGFLPSEWEAEYAAAGGSQQREYPWGSTDPGTANQYAIYGDGRTTTCYYPGPGLQMCSGTMNIAPVGTAALGAGRWGQLDLAGEVSGWVVDWATSPWQPCLDCASLIPDMGNPYRVVWGGVYFSSEADLVVTWMRLSGAPTLRIDTNGIRCARAP